MGNYKCIGYYNITSQTCKERIVTDKLGLLNGQCDDTTNPKIVCPIGTFCNNKVCRKLSILDEFCKI
jgi:hypothetical protein